MINDVDALLAARAAEIVSAEAQVPTEAQTIEEEFETRKLEFARTCPDYEETMASACDCVLLPHIVDFIKTASGGPRVGYHLAKNRHLLSAISELAVDEALAELRTLEAQLIPAAPPTPAPQPSWCESWWIECFRAQFECTATPDEKRATADLARLYVWEPDTQPN